MLIDENPDTVNDAAFAVIMNRQRWAACWKDGPGTLHGNACPLSFADGHAEIKQWRDPQTATVQVTYRREFPHGVVQTYNIDVQWLQDRTTTWRGRQEPGSLEPSHGTTPGLQLPAPPVFAPDVLRGFRRILGQHIRPVPFEFLAGTHRHAAEQHDLGQIGCHIEIGV